MIRLSVFLEATFEFIELRAATRKRRRVLAAARLSYPQNFRM